MAEKKLSDLAQFHEFCTRGVDDEVKAMVKAKKSLLNTAGDLGNTGLHWASSGGHLAVVKALLEAKASVNAQNAVKDTPLHLAAWRDQVEVIEALVAAKADKGLRNQDGKTPLDLGRSAKARDKLINISKAEAKSSIVVTNDEDSDTD
mmetsp:Transcript_21505/g.52688  ORF Transcript_21505/g.52688 Transcript_21505/m.52688 type:complete len:148 (+) Transcript_21505:246-689(+)|eukprot:CAMPEP_0114512024 /NCGR_PEP_ID=MMETSP0109-20121206/14735_1 /TAXON_ID=29199 /ORGANISM="Chlorarachnion reptans, Strain CCCM449" /LENGTH=147 /DNA_ID=CAMNT_0001691641 /DNA_START=194 /DNA_END=637 /DNA_ORIENTATION=+